MKTLFWKELRQIAPSGALMVIALSAAMIASLRPRIHGYRDAFILSDESLVTIAFGSAAAALVLAFLQTVLEVRRDQWAFLLHRGVSATTVFLAKITAGLLAYAVITLVPLAIAMAWCGWGGIEQYPFSMYHAWPMLAAILASSGLYFAGILAVVWKGPWKFSRILPLGIPCLVVFAVVVVGLKSTDFVPGRVFLLTALEVAVLGIAAWGVFVRSGESPGRPRATTVCLGVVLFAASFVGLFLAVYFAVVLVAEAISNSKDTRIVTSRAVNQAGHVCEFVYGPAVDPTGMKQPILKVTDLDEPETTHYADLVGRMADTRKWTLAQLWDPLPMTHVWEQNSGLFGGSDRQRVLTAMDGRASDRWYFSAADGWLYRYHVEFEESQGIRKREPRLAHVVGPDGFTDPAHRPARNFGTLLAHAGFHLLFEDGLYVVDDANRTVRQVFTAPVGQKIRGLLAPTNDVVAIVCDKTIYLPADLEVPPHLQFNSGYADEGMPVNAQNRHRSLPIPKEVAPFDYFEFAQLADQDVVVFHTGQSWDFDRFVHMTPDGTVLRSRDYRSTDALPTDAVLLLCGLAGVLPAGPLCTAVAADAVHQSTVGTGPGLFVRLSQKSPGIMLLVMLILAGVTAGCGWSANRTTRRYGFDNRARRAWVWVAILFGPAGLVTLWFLRDWPALEACPACTLRRPVNRDACPRCGENFAPPLANGTEFAVADTSPAGVVAI